MPKTCRFRWVEGGNNYHFTYDEKEVLIEVVQERSYPTRLSREELDGLMRRCLESPDQFKGKSGEIFRQYLDERGIELPQIPSP